jgi:hypothetical protein
MLGAELGLKKTPDVKTTRRAQLLGGNALRPKRQSTGSINRRQVAVPASYAKSGH